MTYARLMEELSYGWMSLAGVLNTHTIAANLIERFGTDEQRKTHLPRMATGEVRAAFSLSEPDAGSDTQAIRCKADARRRRVHPRRHEDVGHQRRARRARRARGEDARGHHVLHRREGSRSVVRWHLGVEDDPEARATRASRPSR